MNEETFSTSVQRGLRPEIAKRRILSFDKRFGPAHLALAYHAAFPLALTPELLYHLWANFPRDIHGKQLNIPWIAVADLLLSSLCDEVSQELYEMNVTVRTELLNGLKASLSFGDQRIRELSDFLLAYIERHLDSPNSDVRNFAHAQQWTALAYTRPHEAASKLAEAFSRLDWNDSAEQLRMASLVETFAEPLAAFTPLLMHAKRVERIARGEMEDAAIQFNEAVKIERVESQGSIEIIEEAQHASNDLEIEAEIEGVELRSPIEALEEAQRASGEPATQERLLENIQGESIKPLQPQFLEDDEDESESIEPLQPPSLEDDEDEIDHAPYSSPPPVFTGSNKVRQRTSRFGSYVTYLCPSCFEEICLGDCRIINTQNMTVIKDAPIPEDRDRARKNVEPLTGKFYTSQMAQRECPNPECGYLLPYNIESVPSITIAVVGDPFSGKSHYIAALIERLENYWINQFHDIGASLQCRTKNVRDEYQMNLPKSIFDAKHAVNPGRRAIPYITPLIYELSIKNTSFVSRNVKRYNIMIYDTAGEDYANASQLVRYGVFALHTDAFIFAADPVSIRQIYQKLPASLQTQLQVNHLSGRRPAEIVKSVISVFQRFHNYKTGPSLSSIPIALMVTKADLFQYLTEAPQSPSLLYPYHFMRNPSYGSKANLRDLQVVDREVRELLKIYEQNDLLAVMEMFKHANCFATSATGEPPDYYSGEFQNVKPHRCLDPLLWIFYQLGIIKGQR